MFEGIATTLLILLPTSFAFCQLGDCSTKAHPGCPVAEFHDYEIYRPLKHIKPPMKDPRHLFNLLNDQSEEDCTELVLNSGYPERGVFSYYFNIFCRSQGVHLSLEVYYRQDTTSCFARTNESLWMARRCKIFAKERIRLNFIRDFGLLLVEDLSTNSWLMLRKQVKPVDDGRCKCTRLYQHINIFDRCLHAYTSQEWSKPMAEHQSQSRVGYLLTIGVISCLVLLVVAWELTDPKRCRSARVASVIRTSKAENLLDREEKGMDRASKERDGREIYPVEFI